MTNPLPELQKGDAVRYGKDWMSYCGSFYGKQDEFIGWNLDSDGKYQMVAIPESYIEAVWRDLVCIWRKAC